jgi:hypothetical protein
MPPEPAPSGRDEIPEIPARRGSVRTPQGRPRSSCAKPAAGGSDRAGRARRRADVPEARGADGQRTRRSGSGDYVRKAWCCDH